ncbi:DNA primase family protein [Clostridium perfringens]|uniref:DNA primase family protein n=1 Tax=Clostridium perfringens TaxID=1502 RepID=UPI0022E6E015|nr:DNA primase family protein [Clostridium perfringens]
MRVKSVNQLVNEFITEEIKVRECPDSLYRILTLLDEIKRSKSELAYIKLKKHCDVIDDKLFLALVETVQNCISINQEIIENTNNIVIDENLLNELKLLVSNIKAKSLGFYYDNKGKVKLNSNICISYLTMIAKFIKMNDVLMIYNKKEGIFEEASEELIGTILRYLINNAISDSWKKSYEKDIIDGLIREVPIVDTSNINDELIAFNNGVYNIKTKQLLPHDYKYMFTSKSPIDYIEGADCPVFKQAIKDIMCNDYELISCVQEIFGNALINNTKAERAFFFIGVGSNGKSFCSEILTEIIGMRNISNIQLSKFSEKFGIEGIVSKKLNIANENELGGAISTENLKALISGDTVNISRKFKESINYKSTIKLIFLLNTLPDTLDNTHGYYRKILIVPFNRVFKPEEMDKKLKEKVCNELSGVLNWCLEGADRLIQNDYIFTESKEIQKITKAYKEEQNPVETYLNEVLIYEEDSSESKKDILDAYKDWLRYSVISAKGTDSPQRFWKALNNATKINLNKELTYKKVKGIIYLKNFRIDYSKLLVQDNKFIFRR